MSSTRIKDIQTTASAAANDDYVALDGTTNGTRKILASNLGGGSSITVDSAMSNSSENPVQNKVIYTALQGKQDTLEINVSGTDYPITSITTATVNGVSGVLVHYDDGSLGGVDIFFADGVGLNAVKTTIEGEIPTVTSLTVSLVVANWSTNTQTVTATGVTSSSDVIVSPAPSDMDDYVAAGIKCTAQAANSLTFTCTTEPTSAIDVNVVSIA